MSDLLEHRGSHPIKRLTMNSNKFMKKMLSIGACILVMLIVISFKVILSRKYAAYDSVKIDGSINQLSFARSGNELLASSSDGEVVIIKGGNEHIVKELANSHKRIYSYWSSDLKSIVSTEFDPNYPTKGRVVSRRVSDGGVEWSNDQKGYCVWDLETSVNSPFLYCVCSSGVIQIRRCMDGRVVKQINDSPTQIKISNSGKLIAYGYDDGSANVRYLTSHIPLSSSMFDTNSQSTISTSIYPKSVSGIEFDEADRSLTVSTFSSRDPSIQVWNLRKKTLICGSSGYVGTLCMAISPKLRLLATAGSDGSLSLRDPKNLTIKECLIAPNINVGFMSLAFSPDGKLLAAGCSDGTIKFWHLK